MLAAGATGRPGAGNVKLGGDFPQFHVAGTILNGPEPSALYDFTLQEQLFLALRPGEATLRLPFIYPPWVALFFSPIARLPYAWAFAAWSGLSLTLYLAGLLVLLRRFHPATSSHRTTILLLALSFEPFLFETLIGGQLSSIAFLAFALAIEQDLCRRQFLSGLSLALCLYKPNLLVLVLPMLVFTRRWRTLGGVVAGGTLLVALTTLVLGPSLLIDYLSVARYFSQLYMSSTDVLRGWKYVDVRSATTLLTGSPSLGLVVLAVCAYLTGLALLRQWRRDSQSSARESATVWATTIAWTLLLNVYVPFYDCALVVLPLLLLTWTHDGTHQLGRHACLQWLILLMYVGAWFSQGFALATRVQVYTILLLALGAYSIRQVSPEESLPPGRTAQGPSG